MGKRARWDSPTIRNGIETGARLPQAIPAQRAARANGRAFTCRAHHAERAVAVAVAQLRAERYIIPDAHVRAVAGWMLAGDRFIGQPVTADGLVTQARQRLLAGAR